MSRILLIRHGESEWNALGRWQGQADPPLSEHGRHQARVAAAKLGTVDLVVTSTLQRAAVTAAIIAESLGVGPVVADPRLIERDAGEWSGLTRAEITVAWPGYLAADPDDRARERRPPGWEPDSSLLDRAGAAMADVVDRVGGSGNALVVTHGGVIYATEAALGATRRYLPNLGARWVEIERSTPGSPAEMLAPPTRLGERIHLYDPEADGPDATPVDTDAV